MRQPIDTVRRDGEFVVLEDEVSGTYDIARWSADTAAWVCEDGARSRIMPTHWHPLMQEHHRTHSLEDIGSSMSDATPPPGAKAAPGAIAAMMRDVAAPPGATTDIRHARRRHAIAPIAAFLAAGAVAGWWLDRSEVASVDMTVPAATQGGEDVAQVNQLPQREPQMPAVPSRTASDEASEVRQAAERTAVELRQAVQQERDKAETLARDLAVARREIETQTAMVRAAGSEAAQAKEAAERTAVELRQAVQQERDKAETLARDLAVARREIETQTAKARTADSEAARAEEAAEGTATARQAQQEERARADVLARDLAAARREIEAQVAASGKSVDEAASLQRAAEGAAAELRQALQQEHDKAEKLAQELATARRELETQVAALSKAGDKTLHNQQLTELRQELKQAEASAATYQEPLAQERIRSQALEQQLAARRDATPGRGHTATASLSDAPGSTQATATDKPATLPLPMNDKPATPADDKPAIVVARPSAPEAPGVSEAPRLMARASLLLRQGDVGGARIVLERAAETGGAPALFALAETYDPVALSAWGTFGTQGDAGKARELYAKAFAGGVQEAKDRLDALR